MFEGSENLDFSVPAKDQEPSSGYVPGRSIVLVRNPSYDPATDGLRPAYPDRIEATIGGDPADLFNKVSTGEVDYVNDVGDVPANVMQQYSTNPDLQPYLHTYQQNAATYISMNLGVPPFDDVHVRKALNYAYDKAGGRQLSGGVLTGTNAGHIFPDGLLDNILKDYGSRKPCSGNTDGRRSLRYAINNLMHINPGTPASSPAGRRFHRAGTVPVGSVRVRAWRGRPGPLRSRR
jgi:ABC-type transport system substrate-binding protein